MISRLLKTVLHALAAPVRALVKAPLKLVLMLILVAVIAVVLLTNAVQVLGQRGNLCTVEQLAGAGVNGAPVGSSAGEGASVSGAGAVYECIMVLGAGVRPDGSPTPMLQERLDTGIELYHAGVAPKIIMSGDNQSDRETYNEVENMRAYAVAQGVPSADIFCDHAGICTYDSAYRLFHVFGVQRAVVVSQQYHLYRALFDTQSFGIEAVGVPADRVDYPVKLYYNLREAAARISDTWKVLTRANATYLSEPVSLDQSGEVTSWEYSTD